MLYAYETLEAVLFYKCNGLTLPYAAGTFFVRRASFISLRK